ncbi:MAG TPA: GTPase [Candidatus Binataceae bacterium]|jgi:uncharacterized protein (DUF697 family)|nr:GTPase [Candidatus Binataceae bacterium]
MAIDRNRLKFLISDIDELFESFSAPLGERVRDWIQTAIMGPAFAELREFIEESRPPVLFLAGRSGHGKSSVINALAGKKVAETGHVKPTTPEALAHLITFPERFATWQVVDSRGIFETSPPGGAPTPDATGELSDAILQYRPDVVLHVISTPEVRALANDLRVMSEIMDGLRGRTGGETPLVVVLSKPDIIGNPREWPPERYSRKAAQIKEALDYFVSDALQIKAGFRPLDLNTPYRGYEFDPNERNVFCVVPVFALEEEPAWNVEMLVQAIGDRLPKSARLDFYQAQQRKEFLRRLSDSVIKRFAGIATAVGSSPIPVADIAVLTPLQLMMIAVISGLSCQQLSLGSATQYLTAAGINLGGAVGMRTVAQQLIKLIPGAGPVVSGGIAGAGTYALGKSAQTYFFSGEMKKPEEFEER